MASLLAAGVADRGFAVVSGGAYGIDAAAHHAAMVAGGITVAVLAGGVDVPYPRGNASLLARITETGLLVSEVPPGGTPWRQRFLSRNRLIAAMSAATVIVEAGLRSGALNTARHARRLGRPLLGVPGPVTSALSAGVHAMLREHPEARLVTDAAEVAEEAGAVGELAERPRAAEGVRDRLSEVLNDVLEAVPGRGVHPASRIAAAVRLPPGTVTTFLHALRDHGLVEQTPDGYRLTALGRAPSAMIRAPDGALVPE